MFSYIELLNLVSTSLQVIQFPQFWIIPLIPININTDSNSFLWASPECNILLTHETLWPPQGNDKNLVASKHPTRGLCSQSAGLFVVPSFQKERQSLGYCFWPASNSGFGRRNSLCCISRIRLQKYMTPIFCSQLTCSFPFWVFLLHCC